MYKSTFNCSWNLDITVLHCLFLKKILNWKCLNTLVDLLYICSFPTKHNLAVNVLSSLFSKSGPQDLLPTMQLSPYQQCIKYDKSPHITLPTQQQNLLNYKKIPCKKCFSLICKDKYVSTLIYLHLVLMFVTTGQVK